MLTIEVPLVRVRRGKCVGFAEHTPEVQPKPEKVSAAARALALGHRIVKAVESGEVRDFTDAARRMGVSQPRVSMLVGLTFLAPDIQESILTGRDEWENQRCFSLIRIARIPQWKAQRVDSE